MSFNFLTDNFLLGATVTALTGGVNAQFPLANLQHPFTTKVFRSTSGPSSIQVDLLATRTVDSFAIVGNALSGLGINAISIYGSNTTDFTSSTEIEIDISADYNTGFKFFTPVAFRFWKIECTSTESFVELSNIYLGSRTTIVDNGLSTDSFNYKVDDNSEISENQFGQRFIDKKNQVESISGSFQYLNKEESEQLADVYAKHGRHTPLWIVLDPDSCLATDGKFIYTGNFYLNNDFSLTGAGPALYNLSIALRQVI